MLPDAEHSRRALSTWVWRIVALPALRTPSSEFGATPYAALSHCWGGDIPGKTVKRNVEARKFGIPNRDIALTFRDAIRITRELGIRYLWIDALCIIQDSAEEWAQESVKMMSLYAMATVTISALEARSSSAGILKRQSIPFAVLSDDYVAQMNLRPFPESLGECPLDSRAWCMQERLLAPAILHFGEEQMFWKCRIHQAYEDGRVDPEGTWYYDNVSSFMKLRKSINLGTTGEWGTWYHIVEDYSRRNLTVASDKLPAIAGAAQTFREAQSCRTAPTYVAGLWKQDIRRGIAWGAHYHHGANRKVGGYASDRCAVLTRPRQQRAPSWSWASVDSQVAFRWRGDHDLKLDVRMARGENNLMEASPAGTLEVWGTLASVLYYPPAEKSHDVGCLAFGSDPDPSDRSKTLPGCVLDTHRDQPRACWAVNIGTHSDQLWLVLHLREDGLFERIGLCTGNFAGQSFVSDDTFVEKRVSIV
ncbi:hypothetical protein MFIFM68171_04780 [Madurella fahalii]|uniref:Heterokaryon incompatibility domain-containing protein n=1 Tax=Madurella fahalii TaxID=1157608 RepID=A0ABQ0G9Y1_9PEZI